MGKVWEYRPTAHKTEHHGKARIIMIGPRAQAVLAPWLDGDGPIFGRLVASYRRAIHRGCDRAGIPRWSPNRLRHTAATMIRRDFGLEAGAVVLGHAKIETTQVYAERDLGRAREVMRQVG